MILKKEATAGIAESGDVEVTAGPRLQGGIEIELESKVKRIFGDAILETVRSVLEALDVSDAFVCVHDCSALDPVIRARTQTALCRAAEIEYDWSLEDKPHE